MKHLISLWRALNVEKARQLTKGKEVRLKNDIQYSKVIQGKIIYFLEGSI